MKLRKLKSKMRFSRESVFIFARANKYLKANESMRFHEIKIVVKTVVDVLVIEGILFLILK